MQHHLGLLVLVKPVCGVLARQLPLVAEVPRVVERPVNLSLELVEEEVVVAEEAVVGVVVVVVVGMLVEGKHAHTQRLR